MRNIICLILALLAMPAFAQERYDNARFGYSITIPQGFVGQGESDNGDGQAYAIGGKAIDLLVWGGQVMEPDFESEVAAAEGYAIEDAWTVTNHTVTPRWASFSAIKGFRLLHQRLITLCEPGSYAAVRVEYSVTDAGALEPMIAQMEKSFTSGC